MHRRLQEQREAELAQKFGASALPGATESEQRGLYCGAVITAVLHGTNECSSLRETAKTGGC